MTCVSKTSTQSSLQKAPKKQKERQSHGKLMAKLKQVKK